MVKHHDTNKGISDASPDQTPVIPFLTKNGMARVDLIIPTFDRIVEVKRLFESLSVQTFRDFQIILVDQNADTRLDTMVERYSLIMSITHLRFPRSGASCARNRGFIYSQGDILFWPDDDCWYPPELLERAVASFDMQPDLSGLIGIMIDEKGDAHSRWVPHRNNRATLFDVFIQGAEPAIILRRQVVEQFGGFDEQIGTGAQSPWGAGEGTDLCVRAIKKGVKFEVNPKLVIYHANPVIIPRDIQQRQKGKSYARGMGAVLKKNHLNMAFSIRYLLTYVRALLWNSVRLQWADACFHWNRLTGLIEGWHAYPDAQRLYFR